MLRRSGSARGALVSADQAQLNDLVDHREADRDLVSFRFYEAREFCDEASLGRWSGGVPFVLDVLEVVLVGSPPVTQPFVVHDREDPWQQEVTEFGGEDG